jgi:GAF domain-containing protein
MNPSSKESDLKNFPLDLSNTERLILSYIQSHPPEECMLDKITKGVSRSRATILKYLEILYAKDILSYKFVGRSKLWYLKIAPEEKIDLIENIPEEMAYEVNLEAAELVQKANKLHNLILDELKLKKSLDSTENIVFTVNPNLDFVAGNEQFKTIFGNRKNLLNIIPENQSLLITTEINALNSESKKNLKLNLEEKQGIYRPYSFQLNPIFDDKNGIRGTVFLGSELSETLQTKKELKTLLFIARVAGSAKNEEELLSEVSKGINVIIPFEACSIVLKDSQQDSDRLYFAYQTPEPVFTEINSFLKLFINKSIEKRETISERTGEYYLESIKSEIGDNSLNLALSIPIIDEDQAIGSILLLSKQESLSSNKLENVEMAADEIAGYLKLQKIQREKEEFAKTLLAMNQISNIINSTQNENEMLEESVNSTIQSLGFDMGCIYLNDDNEDLALRVQKNLPETLQKMCVAGMFKDLFSKIFEKENLVYITPASPDYDSLDPAIYTGGLKTLLILPIKTGNEIIGILNMGSRQIKAYNEISLENLSSIGLQLGTALEKSKMAIKLNQNPD